MSKNLKDIYKGVYKRWHESQNDSKAIKDIAEEMKEDAYNCAVKLNKTNINRLRRSEEKFLKLKNKNHLMRYWKYFQFILEHNLPNHFKESNINFAQNPKYFQKEVGFFYAISSESRLTFLKFGKTKNSLYKRVQQLMSKFGEFDYSLDFAFKVDDYSLLESLVEKHYKHLRISGRTNQSSREWYEIDSFSARLGVKELIHNNNLKLIERVKSDEIDNINLRLYEFIKMRRFDS